jgi:hypothetical protein
VLFAGAMEDIHSHLKNLEERHVRAVRGLEKLVKVMEHVRAGRDELDALVGSRSSDTPLRGLPEQLQSVEQALSEEISRTRAYILDVEIDQAYLRRRLHGGGGNQAGS